VNFDMTMTLKKAVMNYLEAVTKDAVDKVRLKKITKVVSGKQITEPEKVREFCQMLLTEMEELKTPKQFEKIIPLSQYCLSHRKPSPKSKRK
jgi:hypothetical protein